MIKKNKTKSGQARRVLSGHEQQGKTFIPPWLKLEGLVYADWVGKTIPELLWLGLLNHRYGLEAAVDLSHSLARAATDANKLEQSHFVSEEETTNGAEFFRICFVATSSYASLTESQQGYVREEMLQQDKLISIIEALMPLAAYYPECPLNFLFKDELLKIEDDTLDSLRFALGQLFDKRGKSATMVLADAIYVAIATERLQVNQGSLLSKLNSIVNYPDTEESRAVASSLRATINVLMDTDMSCSWPNYFWTRGRDIERCDYEWIYNTYEQF